MPQKMSSASSMICLIRCWWPICGRMPGSVMSTASCSSARLRAAASSRCFARRACPRSAGASRWRACPSRTILGGELAHHAHQAGDTTLATEQLNTRSLELGGVIAPATSSLASSSSLTRSSIRLMSSLSSLAHPLAAAAGATRSCGCAARFGNKKTALGHVHCPRTVEFRGTTLFDPADVWPAAPTLCPLSRGSRLPYWGFAAAGRVPVEVAARE